MTLLLAALRWIHLLAAAAWLGEVVVINFVLLPTLFRMEPAERGRFLARVFPLVFRLASFLAVTTLGAGAILMLLRTQGQLALLVSTRWGWIILLSGAAGLLLALFHFFVEGRLREPVAAAASNPDSEAVEQVYRRLRTIPRGGLLVMVIIFISMIVAAHGGI